MISQKAASLGESLTLKISATAKDMTAEGIDVVNLAVGEPDFDTPDYISEAGIRAIREGKTRYTKVSGIDPLREAICEKYRNFNGMEITKDQVIVSTGAKQNLINALVALTDPGDEVLIPCPYWLSYPEMVKLSGGKAVLVKGVEGKVTPEDLEEKLTDRTKILILNNPSNPTGIVYTKDELRAIGEFCIENDLYIIADEIYERLIYDGEAVSIASLSDEIFERTVTVSGFSKSYAMTGWRLGYSVQSTELTKALEKIQSHTTSNANTISQYAGLAALTEEDETVEEMIETFKGRRDYLKGALEDLGFDCLPMKGAFYAFFNIAPWKKTDSVAFCEDLLEKAHIAAVPGKVFGDDDYIRFSYATSMENLKKAVERLKEYIKGE